jgi:hypothetical protein
VYFNLHLIEELLVCTGVHVKINKQNIDYLLCTFCLISSHGLSLVSGVYL